MDGVRILGASVMLALGCSGPGADGSASRARPTKAVCSVQFVPPMESPRTVPPPTTRMHKVVSLRRGPPSVRHGGEQGLSPGSHLTDPVDMRLLVIAANRQETDLTSIETFLNRVGVPYSTLIATETDLTPEMLWDGEHHGYFQGVILTTGNLVYETLDLAWESAFDETEWGALWDYEAAFGARQVTAYTMPEGEPDSYGLGFAAEVDTEMAALQAVLTPAGRQVFSYLNPNVTIKVEHAWTFLATVQDPADTTPLLLTEDGQHVLAAVHRYADGRENLAVTTANGAESRHSVLLAYGLINWVTRGVFLGERHVNIGVQVDDLFLGGDMWDITANPPSAETGLVFRMSGDDYRLLMQWQDQPRPVEPPLALELAFNGWGATGVYPGDTLTPAVIQDNDRFQWTSHTYDHKTLDDLSYAEAASELERNDDVAESILGLVHRDATAMVQPSVSGLDNPEFLRAAADHGIVNLVSDTSLPGWDSPSFNAGFVSNHDPRVFIVPRRPANLYCNVSTPAEWVSQYNAIYGPAGMKPYWDHDLAFEEILAFESSRWLRRLLSWEVNPYMFHQSNLRAYNGDAHSLLGDLIDATIASYTALYDLPIRNLRESEAGDLMQRRMAYDASGVTGTLVRSAEDPARCSSITLTTTSDAIIPVTGVSFGGERETYGGQPISYVVVSAGVPVTLPASACE